MVVGKQERQYSYRSSECFKYLLPGDQTVSYGGQTIRFDAESGVKP